MCFDPLSDLTDQEKGVLSLFQGILATGRIPFEVDDQGITLEKPKEKEKNNASAPSSSTSPSSSDLILTEKEIEFCDTMCLLRYLRAREWKLSKSVKMLRGTLEWRREEKIDDLSITTHKFIESAASRGNMYLNGIDLKGQPIIVLRPNTYADPHNNKEKLLFMAWSMELAIKAMDKSKGVEKMVWIASLDGYNMKHNGDMRFAMDLLNMLQNHFPERLGQAFLFDLPFVFRMAWKAVYPFMHENTKKKVQFIEGQKRGEILQNFIDLSNVETCFGGNGNFRYEHKTYVSKALKIEGVPESSFISIFGAEGPPPPKYLAKTSPGGLLATSSSVTAASFANSPESANPPAEDDPELLKLQKEVEKLALEKEQKDAEHDRLVKEAAKEASFDADSQESHHHHLNPLHHPHRHHHHAA